MLLRLLMSKRGSLRPGTKGLPVENYLLAIISGKVMELNQNLTHVKNSSPLTL